jgi:[NiFe] hydrogenase diaphorase moiety large subunit
MTIAGYAIGADEGILYLRGEYAYLRAYLEHVLRSGAGRPARATTSWASKDFNFDIRIQMGAGAYICGEETP